MLEEELGRGQWHQEPCTGLRRWASWSCWRTRGHLPPVAAGSPWPRAGGLLPDSLAGGGPRGPGASCALLPTFLLSPPLRVAPIIVAFPQMDPTEPRATGQERTQGRAHAESQGAFLRARKRPAPPSAAEPHVVAVRSRREPSALCWDRVWRGRPRGWPGCPTGLRAPQSGSSLPAAPRCDLAPHPMPDSPPVVGDGGASLLCPGLSKPSAPPTPHPGSRSEAVCQMPCPLEQQTLLAGAPACSPSSGTGSL